MVDKLFEGGGGSKSKGDNWCEITKRRGKGLETIKHSNIKKKNPLFTPNILLDGSRFNVYI